MNILISGASGFIGLHLLDYLRNADHDILAISRKAKQISKNINWLQGDISNPETFIDAVNKFQPEVIYHLAWDGIPDFSEAVCHANAVSSLNFLGLVSKVPSVKKIIVSGSCWEYGDVTGPCSENLKTIPHNPFTQAKDEIRKFVANLGTKNNIDWYWGRVFFVYGPGQRKQSLVPSVINSIKSGEILDIRAPYAKNDFIYVDDLVHGLACCLDLDAPSGIYNFGSGKESSVLEIVRVIENVLHGNNMMSDQIVKNISQPDGRVKSFYADTNKSRASLGWVAKTDIESGIKKTIGEECQ